MSLGPEKQHPEEGKGETPLHASNFDNALITELASLPEGVYEIQSKTGEIFEARFIEEEDAQEISDIVQQNFDEAPSYLNLTSEARQKYKEANTPEGILETSSDDRNIASLVVRDKDGQVVGYRVIRKGVLREPFHDFEPGTPVAEGKRMHIARGYDGQGLGTALLRLSEEIAVDRGYQVMVVNASGDSYHFFMRAGYEVIAHEDNPDLAAAGVRANRTYLGRQLTKTSEA